MEIKYSLDMVGNFRLFNFATGSYTCKCSICGCDFIGDKRSLTCMKCAIEQANIAAQAANSTGEAPQPTGASTPLVCGGCGGPLDERNEVVLCSQCYESVAC
jgi:hypothetical protein